MTKRHSMLTAFLCAVGMIALILDSKTAMNGASEGIKICLRTVIPSLLPFFVLSILITNNLFGASLPLLPHLGRLCGMPKGSEHILLIGLLGGYPVGAQTVAQAYDSKQIEKQEAHRMLGFCNNAGPAFIFGVAGSLFSSKLTVLLLWVIHILSALLVASVIPGKTSRRCNTRSTEKITLPQALSKSLRIMANVCGWIIIFRILISFLDRWFLWLLPQPWRLLVIGLLESANGCFNLTEIQSEAMRFILCSIILAFGGICVGMQTVCVTEKLGTGWYFIEKMLQAGFSVVLSTVTTLLLFKKSINPLFLSAIFLILILAIFLIRKKTVAFPDKSVYNN